MLQLKFKKIIIELAFSNLLHNDNEHKKEVKEIVFFWSSGDTDFSPLSPIRLLYQWRGAKLIRYSWHVALEVAL
jgi:hypothetical protein